MKVEDPDDAWDLPPPKPKPAEPAARPFVYSTEMGTPAAKILELARPKMGDLTSTYGFSIYDVETRTVEWWGHNLEKVTELIVRRVGHEGINKRLQIRNGLVLTYPMIYEPRFRK